MIMTTSTHTNRSTVASTGDLQDDLAALREDLRSLKEDFKNLATDAVGKSKAHATAAATAAKESATEHFDKSVKATREAVEERPLTSLLIAAGIGALVGAVLTRR
jgi:ElaB/YqjD/DUF883 family membrane-anchored ribosome-binding protein